MRGTLAKRFPQTKASHFLNSIERSLWIAFYIESKDEILHYVSFMQLLNGTESAVPLAKELDSPGFLMPCSR
ncbi:hypothetical protein B1J94_09750 [Leptospira kirschneri serovar Grippotyphosa]|nr:hypothetical protein B1J94_09750 [Leptospira kirschneri serovar Grippotyphosa]